MSLQKFVLVGNLSEAEFDSDARTAKLTVIKKGWSKNGFYYGDSALESVANLINSSAERVYDNHNKRKEMFEPRKEEDHIANNVAGSAAVSEDGQSVTVKAKFFKSGPKAWVFERMQETPHTYGPSIVGKASVKKGTVEGRTGPIVNEVTWLHSYDMVSNPSAGGKVNEVSESVTPTENASEFVHIFEGFEQDLDDSVGDDLFEGVDLEDVSDAETPEKLATQIKRINQRNELRDKWWELEGTYTGAVRDIVMAQGDYEFTAVSERRKLFKMLTKDFATEVGKLTFLDPLPLPKKPVGEAAITSMGTEVKAVLFDPGKFEKNSFKKIVISKENGIGATVGTRKGGKIKAIRSYHFDVSNGWTADLVKAWIGKNIEQKTTNSSEGVENMDIRTLADLKASDSTLYEALVTEAIQASENKEQVTQWKADSASLSEAQTKLKDTETKLSEATEAKEKAEKEAKDLTESLKEYKDSEVEAEKASVVAEIKKEVGLVDENCSEQFSADLLNFDFADKDAFRKSVKSRVEDRFTLVSKAPVVRKKVIEGHGASTPNQDAEDKVPDNKALAASLKG